MLMSGFIKLDRNFFKNPFWKENRSYSRAEAWIDLIQMARFENSPEKILVKNKLITINRGEIRASQRFLSERWGWSLGKVNRFISVLEVEHMVERRVEHSETIVKLLKYNVFNSSNDNEMNTNGTESGTPTEHQQEQTKESKEREENKDISTENPKPDFGYKFFTDIRNVKDAYEKYEGNKKYFLLALRYWQLWSSKTKSSKTLLNARIDDWVKSIRLIVENDKQPISRMVAIYCYFSHCANDDAGYDNFWFKTIKSVGAFRKEDKDKVYYLDKIIQVVQDKVDEDQKFQDEVKTAIEKFNK